MGGSMDWRKDWMLARWVFLNAVPLLTLTSAGHGQSKKRDISEVYLHDITSYDVVLNPMRRPILGQHQSPYTLDRQHRWYVLAVHSSSDFG